MSINRVIAECVSQSLQVHSPVAVLLPLCLFYESNGDFFRKKNDLPPDQGHAAGVQSVFSLFCVHRVSAK